ncbi:MAG: hypothetical protein R2867_37995 [Caldilineaceae bacterium]
MEKGAQLGGDDNTANSTMPEQINTGLTLTGKGAVVPENLVIGRNVVVHPDAGHCLVAAKTIASGASIGKKQALATPD